MSERGARALAPRKWFLIAAAILALLFVGAVMTRAKEAPAAAAASAETTPPPGTFRPTKEQLQGLTIVEVGKLRFQPEQRTDGTIAANDDTSTQVFSPLSGRVTAVFAKLGDSVGKGTPLMSVEASEVVQGQNDLLTAVATVNSAQAQVRLTAATEQRQHELLLAKAGALKDWLQSQSDAAAAQAALTSAQVALDAARNRLAILGKTASEIDALQRSAGTHVMTPSAIVRSPIAGTIIQRQVGTGQYIESGANGGGAAVFTVSNLSTVWLVANVREDEAGGVRIGQPVRVHVPAWPGREFTARVAWVAAGLDPNTHRLPVRAEIDNGDGALKPMMFADFDIRTGPAIDGPGIPQEAIVYEGADAHVFVAGNDGTLALRSVQTGQVSGDMVQITQGLAAGERVVTRGALFIDRATEVK